MKKISRNDFAALCGEYLIPVELALENSNIITGLRNRDIGKVREVLETEF